MYTWSNLLGGCIDDLASQPTMRQPNASMTKAT
jgi:hypothetical protein